MGKAEYKVDLVELQTQCETNYARFLKLLPGLEKKEQAHLAVRMGSQQFMVTFTVVERCKYTTVLSMRYEQGLGSWLILPLFQVRLYHDVSMAEVISIHKQRNTAAKYPYPNPQMFYPDEKAQHNRLLSECLVNCLEHGYDLDMVSIPSQ
ncbi:DUF1249 domain-containing protein [Zooshikella marina]|uniref:DUF1249 domain-containing protein n=1 Tax=Zooshikella ganghwensis TaxID=202772 RepID=A0A4P9VH99_9GAMM|nr:DUF1249 domain-containing protein [Zooshikella ganghwensis]MBU2706224.1 DUF1249 domain-containing protein [Zooshikella ganghwensis]RDH42483.1 DUF1249 domain-containing protein [Zooshikella ganghwensis]